MELLEYLVLESRLCDVFQVLPLALLAGGIGAAMPGSGRVRRGMGSAYLTAVLCIVCTPAYFWRGIWQCVLSKAPWSALPGLLSPSPGSGGYAFALKPMGYLFSCSAWGRFMYLSNVALFVPFGPLFAQGRGWRAWLRVTLQAAALGLAMELYQPCLGRWFDANDLMAYAIGTQLGLLGRWVFGFWRKKQSG